MIRAVLDTNVLASGTVRANPASAPVQLIDRWLLGDYELALSEHILDELTHTFSRSYFVQRVGAAGAADMLALLRTRAMRVRELPRVEGVATHPEDDLILAAAVGARANYLVTGDAQLQRLGGYAGVAIVGPGAFLALLEAEATRPE